MEALAPAIPMSRKLKASLALITAVICHLQTSLIMGLLLLPQPMSLGLSLTLARWFALQAIFLSKNHCQAAVSCVLSDYPGKKVLSVGHICHSGP